MRVNNPHVKSAAIAVTIGCAVILLLKLFTINNHRHYEKITSDAQDIVAVLEIGLPKGLENNLLCSGSATQKVRKLNYGIRCRQGASAKNLLSEMAERGPDLALVPLRHYLEVGSKADYPATIVAVISHTMQDIADLEIQNIQEDTVQQLQIINSSASAYAYSLSLKALAPSVYSHQTLVLVAKRDVTETHPKAVQALLGGYFEEVALQKRNVLNNPKIIDLKENADEWFGIGRKGIEGIIAEIDGEIDTLRDQGMHVYLPEGNPYRITNRLFIEALIRDGGTITSLNQADTSARLTGVVEPEQSISIYNYFQSKISGIVAYFSKSPIRTIFTILFCTFFLIIGAFYTGQRRLFITFFWFYGSFFLYEGLFSVEFSFVTSFITALLLTVFLKYVPPFLITYLERKGYISDGMDWLEYHE